MREREIVFTIEDVSDRGAEVAWAQPNPSWWQRLLGITPPLAYVRPYDGWVELTGRHGDQTHRVMYNPAEVPRAEAEKFIRDAVTKNTTSSDCPLDAPLEQVQDFRNGMVTDA